MTRRHARRITKPNAGPRQPGSFQDGYLGAGWDAPDGESGTTANEAAAMDLMGQCRGFARVILDPGATARVEFDVPVAALGFTGRDITYIVEPGDIEFFVGRSSADLQPVGRVTVAGDQPVTVRRLVPGAATVTVR